MRRLGLLMVVAACAPAPAERLRDPKPLPGRCKMAEQIGEVERPIFLANQARRDAAIASFIADHHLTRDGIRLPMMADRSAYWVNGNDDLPDPNYVHSMIERSFRHELEPLGIDLVRPVWSQVIVEPLDHDHQPCRRFAPLPPTTYELAHDANGATVVMRTHTARRIATSLVQCGSCSVGCGIPVDGLEWTAVILPISYGVPYRLESLDLIDDDVNIWCERETPAM